MIRKAGSDEDEATVAALTTQLQNDLPPQAKPSLYTKMVAVMGALSGLAPEGKNDHFRYKYWETTQVTGIFRGLFVKHGLSFNADVVDWDIREGKTTKGGSTWLTTIRVLFTITDTVTGERVSGHGIGQGDDPGDKGSNKAMAGALKYWLLKEFLVGGDDAEADVQTDTRAESRAEAKRPRTVKIEDSDVKGIQRGGRSTKTTDIQVQRFRQLSRDLKYGPVAAAKVVEDTLGIEIDLPEEPDDVGPALIRFVSELSADHMGEVIQYMESLSDTSDSE